MRPLIDSHIHTERCGHARGSADAYLASARAAGLEAIVFTEHLPIPAAYDPDGHLSIPDGELPAYCAEIIGLQTGTSDPRTTGTLPQVILGAEADWLPDEHEWTAAQLDRARANGVAVVLGSVHFLGMWAFDDPAELPAWDERSVDEIWLEYADTWCDAAASGLFDVLAHPDLPKKFGHRPSFDPAKMYERMAGAAAEGGALIEVSTAGLRKPVGELYPGPQLLSAFRRAGVDATIGSDAHEPSEVGFGLDRAAEALVDAGYTRIALPLGPGERRWYEL
ncbi:MAG: histidinol phosphatase [Actinobacteria bacterium HGW-Actinobacteria-10]|nr:MAG: histidinol phosphatase [Actinobacteria bacterium HGW-Actinobacteria-10]